MRRFERKAGSIPADLEAKQKAELKKAEPYFAKPKADRKNDKKPDFTVYKLASIKTQLEAIFGGKCAYCESFYSSTAPVDIEHYRPKGQVHEAPDHDGYWWLAADWDNLLPSCIDCNRKRKQLTPTPSADLSQLEKSSKGTQLTNTGKKDSFPLADESKRSTKPGPDLAIEEPLLINPCTEDPEQFLDFSFDPNIGASIVFPRRNAGTPPLNPTGTDVGSDDIRAAAGSNVPELKAAMSIHVYGLNRLGLVQARTRIIRQLEFLAELIIDLDMLVEEVGSSSAGEQLKTKVSNKVASMQGRILDQMTAMAAPEREYSATARAWLEAFRKRLSD